MQIAKYNYMSVRRNKILTLFALINILGTVQSFVSGGAGTGEGSIDRAGVADRALMTRIRRASVIEMTEQTCKKKKATVLLPLIFLFKLLEILIWVIHISFYDAILS